MSDIVKEASNFTGRLADIVTGKADVIVNAANATGWMGGFLGRFILFKGVAEALHYATKGSLEKEAKRIAKTTKAKAGDVFVTESRKPLNSVFVFHACTMDQRGQKSSLEVVERCVIRIDELCQELAVKSIILPYLGCGTGGLNTADVLKLYRKHLAGKPYTVTLSHPKGKIIESTVLRGE